MRLNTIQKKEESRGICQDGKGHDRLGQIVAYVAGQGKGRHESRLGEVDDNRAVRVGGLHINFVDRLDAHHANSLVEHQAGAVGATDQLPTRATDYEGRHRLKLKEKETGIAESDNFSNALIIGNSDTWIG
nr:hypothetical protein HmN_000910700 [Hymenolepis microstoma]